MDGTNRTPNRWAPWWLYLIVLLGANYARAAAMRGMEPALQILAALALAAVLATVVTALWRALR